MKPDFSKKASNRQTDIICYYIKVRYTKAVSHLQTVNLRKEEKDDDDDLEREVFPGNPSLDIRSPIHPAIMPKQSKEEKSSLVSAGILAKVVSHLPAVSGETKSIANVVSHL